MVSNPGNLRLPDRIGPSRFKNIEIVNPFSNEIETRRLGKTMVVTEGGFVPEFIGVTDELGLT